MTPEPTAAEVKRRYQALESWATAFTASLELEIRSDTGVKAFHCFVLDQFEASFPEEHLTRDKATVFIALRLAIDLQSLGPSAVAQIKSQLVALRDSLQILRDNFEDSPLRIDFDWHISERERDGDSGAEFAQKVLSDCRTLTQRLRSIESRFSERSL